MNEPFAHSHEDMAQAVNLMAHPAASMMALSALGFGVASHAMGSWIGVMSAAAEVSQRYWEPLFAGASVNAARVEKSDRPATAGAKVVALRRPAKEIKPAREAMKPALSVAVSSAPAKIEKPAQPDDLKAISGIGPKLEQVLNGLGIWTYAQVAAWTEKEVAWLEESLGMRGRIGRDDWIVQAARLSGGSK